MFGQEEIGQKLPVVCFQKVGEWVFVVSWTVG